MRDVVLRRLRQLGDAELDVLRSAAVVGRTFDLDLIRDISGVSDDLVDEALDRATAAGFVCSEPDSVDQHRFTHAIVQQALFEDTGPMRRRRLHTRIAEVLGAVEGTSLRHAERLIHHLALAGGEPNLDRAIELCLGVASSASSRANYPEVELLLLRALDLAGRLDGPHAQQRELAVLIRLCALYDYFYGVLWPASVGYRERARELIRSSASGRDIIGVLNSIAVNTLAEADFASTDAVLQEMRLTAETLDDDVLRACAYLDEGMSLVQQGAFAQTVESLDAAEALTARFDTEPWAAVLLTPFEVVPGWRMLARMMQNDPTDAEAASSDLETTIGHCTSRIPSIAANAAGLLALRGVLLDDREATLDLARRSVQVAAEAGMQSVAFYLTIVQAWASPDATADRLDALLGPLESPPRMLMRPFLRDLIADAHLRCGRPELALTLRQRSLAEARATGNGIAAPGPARRLDAILTAAGSGGSETAMSVAQP